jgi:apolipoprotein N-acyltransferase
MLRKIIRLSAIGFQLSAKDILLSVASGILLILSFPNFNLWLFSWFGFVPVFFALNNKSRKGTFFLFFITGMIFWSGIVYWLVHVTLAGTILLVLYLALYFAIFGLIIRPCTKHSTPYSLIFIPSAWVLLEYLRGHLMTGFPWALLGHSQYLNLPVIQIADITGAWGVSFLVMAVNVAIIEIIWSWRRRLWPRLRIAVILLISFLFLALCYGYFRLSEHAAPSTQRPIRISVIQGNIPQELKWNPEAKDYIVNKYLELSAEVLKDKPDLIIWPEAALPVILEEEPIFFERVKDSTRDNKTPLLLGAVTKRDNLYYNSALLVSGAGEPAGRYDKLHLVPFGEYIPLKKILPFLETVVPIGDISAGTEYAVFNLDMSAGERLDGKVKFSILICFEDLFPELSRKFKQQGAQFLINITNDAWYKKTSATGQHLQASVFRAVENRLPLVRAANTGVSGFIAPSGKIISLVRDKTGRDIFVDGYNTQEIQIIKRPLSFYTRHGDIFPVLCLLLVLYGIIPRKRIKP